MGVVDEACLRKEWTIISELGQEKHVVNELRRTFEQLEIQEPNLEEIITAVSEACLNAIEHGNRFIKELPVKVTMLIHFDRYIFLVTDQGNGTSIAAAGVDPQVRDKLNWDNPRGWGLQLVRHYADAVNTQWNNGEFCVELRFDRSESYEGNEDMHRVRIKDVHNSSKGENRIEG